MYVFQYVIHVRSHYMELKDKLSSGIDVIVVVCGGLDPAAELPLEVGEVVPVEAVILPIVDVVSPSSSASRGATASAVTNIPAATEVIVTLGNEDEVA